MDEAVRAGTYQYIGGIIAGKDEAILEIGGTADHIHLLTSCSPRIALADLLRSIKTNSSKWLHEERKMPAFGWQNGYGAFTVSCSQIDAVREYIRNQEAHHRKQSIAEESRAMLHRHGIVFEEKYLFDAEHHG